MTAAFELGLGIKTPAGPAPYRRRIGDPLHRPLRVYTQDPSASYLDCAVAVVATPWEPLAPGPSGSLFVVRDFHQPSGGTLTPVDLDSFEAALHQGLKPSSTEPRFAQQMTYAVAMAVYERFRIALGRLPEFSPAIRAHGGGQLEICPHFAEEDNAYYDPERRALCFGYVKAPADSIGRLQAGSHVFTCLSHDVIVHETAHALLDGMRPLLMLPSNPDVAAFHEGLADLLALLMRFRYPDVVRRGLADSGGELNAQLLTQLAKEWGRTGGDGRSPLRQVLLRKGPPDEPVSGEDRYDPDKQHHDLGAVLVAAVFEAIARVFAQKTERLRKIAALAPAAQDAIMEMLAREACKLAGQFLNILIRAIDYCPPLDVTFGEFLRAMITADKVAAPEDPHGYREALVLAFRRYGVTVPDVPDLSEDSLLWRPPEKALPPLARLRFARLRHGCEPGWFPSERERRRQGCALGEFVTSQGRHRYFGIAPPGRADGVRYLPPVIESVRTLRRLTPEDELDFHVVAEISQRCVRDGRTYFGGSTVILDEEGRIAYVIGKGIRNERRRRETDSFLARAPRAYRDAFNADDPNARSLVRQFHAKSKRKSS